MLLERKVSLITGAGNGIGVGTARRFVAEGAIVGVLDIDREACIHTADLLTRAGGRALALPSDICDSIQVRDAVGALANAFGPPTILVHCAAIMPTGTVESTEETDWDRAFAVNVRGAYLVSRAMIPLMRQARGGSIIFMASITGVTGLPGLAAYSATKGALIALARAMAIDHAREGIRVNTVSPGTIDSPMLHRFVTSQKNPDATRRAFDEMYPRGRVGTIDEVASVVAFLASDQAGFVSGANYRVDGGMSYKSEQPRL